ncbi:hypothetical protein [Legionella fairfieldensis]|uniref:hypothetical protein n=1 Tax=Legionella fairfieldensis TaxID=45064 RepID=UPI000AC6C437|nr:hypothetical protein [Legionella fairfieldensis]
MNGTSSSLFNPNELLEQLCDCAHPVLLAYNETMQEKLRSASEKQQRIPVTCYLR